MKVFFSTCAEAIDKAVKEKSFGLYYAEKAHPNQNVHVHDCSEIFLSLSNGRFLIDGEIYDIEKNCLFLINSFQAHKVSPTDENNFVRYSFHVHSKFLLDNSTDTVSFDKYFYSQNKVDVIKLSQEESDKMVNLFKSLTIDHDFADDVYKKIHAVEILLETTKLLQTRNNQKSAVQQTPLKKALDYINDNFTKQISLNDIAKNSFLSVARLCELFKKQLSTTAGKYLTGKRISHAKKLLSQGKSVTDTAIESGFSDYANFIRTFKNAVGVPPGKYKNDNH